MRVQAKVNIADGKRIIRGKCFVTKDVRGSLASDGVRGAWMGG